MFQKRSSTPQLGMYLMTVATWCSLFMMVSGTSLNSWSSVENNTRAERQLLGSWQQAYPYSASLGQRRYPYQPYWNPYSHRPFNPPAPLESLGQRSRPGAAAARVEWVSPEGSTCYPSALSSLLNPFATATTANPTTACPTAAPCSYRNSAAFTACSGFIAPTAAGDTRRYQVTSALTGTVTGPATAGAANDMCYLYITVVPPYKRVRVTCTGAGVNGVVKAFATTTAIGEPAAGPIDLTADLPFFSGSSGTLGLRFSTDTFFGARTCSWTAVIA